MAGRKPFLDNTKLILAGIVALIAALAGLLSLASRSSDVAPDVLAEFVLYALSATNLTILLALLFVLARNIIKLVVEQRRAIPFARFRTRLVIALLGMTLIPAVLVLIVGSELIRNNIDQFFNAPMANILSSARDIASDYYREHQRMVTSVAQRLAKRVATVDLADEPGTARDIVAPDVTQERIDVIEIYRVGPGGQLQTPSIVDVAASVVPRSYSKAGAEQLARQVAQTGRASDIVERLGGQNGGDLVRTAIPLRSSPNGPIRGVLIASDYLTGEFASRARSLTGAYVDYRQLEVLKPALSSVYLSFFLMLTLMILVAATWMGLYLAKRITRPVQVLATAADEIGAGHLDHRVEVEAGDEFASLIDAFNRMAGDLAASRRRLERSAVELEKKHEDVEGRRQYVETVLDRIATGVISVDNDGRIRTWNSAATRLLGIDSRVDGLRVGAVFGSRELEPLARLITERSSRRDDTMPKEVAISRDGRELHLLVMITPFRRAEGRADGLVIVFDDVSPLIRAQRVAAWREVARRLAHEIKNPLTPIQLSAERLQRHFAGAPEATRALVDECAIAIVTEVESLKGLVDEFSQFARMPAPRATPTDLHGLLDEALALYRGLFSDVKIRTRFADSLPKVSADPEQIRRVIINIVDNAIEAVERRGAIDIETQHDAGNSLVRIVVADDGPGIPAAERDRLFLPYYSTKQRGSGLGLAIVRRIVAEHGGSIDVSDNIPRGTRFAIELPC
ncbi:MAG TPA: ATP-binding protein [Vicinamibacterales bacterium]|nr:ATP-binding protein [Vicinamibacterales bacterium]